MMLPVAVVQPGWARRRRNPARRQRVIERLRRKVEHLERRQAKEWGLVRPRNRRQCKNKPRPCPWVSCRYHLLLDVNERGSIRMNLARLEAVERDAGKRTVRRNVGGQRFEAWSDDAVDRLFELSETCALDVADRGAHALHEVGDTMSMTREGARLIEASGLLKMKAAKEAWSEAAGDSVGRREAEDPLGVPESPTSVSVGELSVSSRRGAY